jgi:hypothetical protein
VKIAGKILINQLSDRDLDSGEDRASIVQDHQD